MILYPVEELIPQNNIIVFSPHFDDFLFLMGGYINELKKKGLLQTKKFHIILLFARSNYLAGTGQDNFDTSLERIKLATGKRVLEDLECIDEILGQFNYHYELVGEKECFSRGKAFADSEMEFPHGMYEDFDTQDFEIFDRMQVRIKLWASREDTALIFPMAIKEHIDHFIIREAAIKVAEEMGSNSNAAFYFQEDKPYGGIANSDELTRIEEFIVKHHLLSKFYHYDPEQIIELAFKHYVSQVEEVYKTGIRTRAKNFQSAMGLSLPCDRICLYHPIL